MSLLHANAFDSGAEALGAGIGPICCTMASKPYLTGKLHMVLQMLDQEILWILNRRK